MVLCSIGAGEVLQKPSYNNSLRKGAPSGNQRNISIRKRSILRQRHYRIGQPEMAGLPQWVIALVMAGCVAAALSLRQACYLFFPTISHDLMKKIINPDISDRQEIRYARIASFGALVVSAYFGINPPSNFVAKTVAFAFGLAASSFFPTLIMGIFSKKINKEGAIRMICGLDSPYSHHLLPVSY